MKQQLGDNMRDVRNCAKISSTLGCYITILVLGICSSMPAANAAVSIHGRVVDIDGRPLKQAQVVLTRHDRSPGPYTTTLFTDNSGDFVFTKSQTNENGKGLSIKVRALGYDQLSPGADESVNRIGAIKKHNIEITVVMRRERNLAKLAPSSAWLQGISDPKVKSRIIMRCAQCHQFPAPEVRRVADLYYNLPFPYPEQVREQNWHTMVNFMDVILRNRLVGRGYPSTKVTDFESFFNMYKEANKSLADLLANSMPRRYDRLKSYNYGAPLIVTPKTVIKEYKIPGRASVREAIAVGNTLWEAQVGGDSMVAINMKTGAEKWQHWHFKRTGPHTLVRGKGDVIWIASIFHGILVKMNGRTGKWDKVWHLKVGKRTLGLHDIAYGVNDRVAFDKQGRLWFSDIKDNQLGYLNPATGVVKAIDVPLPKGRGRGMWGAGLYGIVMLNDREHVCYTQLWAGSFGCFNIKTMKFEHMVTLPDKFAGPRRIARARNDILYIPLYGDGQLIKYDARRGKILATYDLPDRASAPYAATWDNKRRVVWISNCNADAIYRFDPRTKSFGVIPLPRHRGFLRQISVDPDTGYLDTSYANAPTLTYGPRMALVINPGDGVK